MENNPKITVLMPVFNEKRQYLTQAIESILNQTFKDFEILILNDGSSDSECLKVLDEYVERDKRIKVVTNEKNLGLTKTLNKGLELAQADYIARLDSDDYSHSERLEKQLKFLEENSDHALCGTWAYIINTENDILGKKKGYTKHKDIEKHIIEQNFLTHSSWFFRKEIIKSIGGYSEEAISTEDYDLLLKLIKEYKVANLPEFLCYYRINMKGISFAKNKLQEKYSIIARWKAIKYYGYPKIYLFKIIKSVLVYLLMPFFVKKLILQFLWKRN